MKKLFVLLFLLLGVCAFSQVSPPSGSYVCPGSVLLDWPDVPQTISYRVQVFQGATTIVDVSGLTQSQYLILAGILQSNTQYYWRIQATGPGGPGPWSTQWMFTTLSIPDSPTLINPPNGAVNVPIHPTFNWNNVPGATYYIFQLSNYPLFDSLIITDSTPLPPITLQNATQYFWRMKSGNSCGRSNWSPVWTFITITTPPPATPILICDTSNVPLTPILDWYDVSNAMSYRVQISTSPVFTITLINAIVTVSQYTVPSGALTYNSHFYWRVNAINGGGSSQWSTICSFNTITQSGIVNITSEIPTENKLYSNYPNPFNPTTKIRFDIPKSDVGQTFLFVTLKVYDITGREIQTLVNETLQPGTYETTFDGSMLNSGVYFYKLVVRQGGSSTDGFSETKKMVLIK